MNIIKITIIVLSFLSTLSHAEKFEATDVEKENIKRINSNFYDSFNQEDNWVKEMSSKGELLPHCYLSKSVSYVIGGKVKFKEMDMTCIKIGVSSRIFWPSRWVEFCDINQLPYRVCLMQKLI